MWFEGVIRDHLDVGRPTQIALVFDRRLSRRMPGTFRTRVLTEEVDPTLCCYYKSSRIKQYFKEGRALRTETVICDTNDFGVAAASVLETGMPYGQLVNPPAGVSVVPKPKTPSLRPMWLPFPR